MNPKPVWYLPQVMLFPAQTQTDRTDSFTTSDKLGRLNVSLKHSYSDTFCLSGNLNVRPSNEQ